MKTRIAYFSWQGHTEQVANALAPLFGADLERISPEGSVHAFSGGIKAVMGMKSAIRPCNADLGDVDLLVVATPVWAGKVPPYVNTYLSLITGGQGKPFAVAAQAGKSGHEGAIAAVRKALEAKGMRFAGSVTSTETGLGTSALQSRFEAFAESVRKAAGPAGGGQ